MGKTSNTAKITFLAFLSLWLFLPSQGTAQNLPTGRDTHFRVGFYPNGVSLDLILQEIAQAERSILVAAYSFTSKPIAQALLKAHRRGVGVFVVADDRGNSSSYTAVTFLANNGVTVRINDNYAIFHHKFMIFDERDVQTGSFNYSAAAFKSNAENVLVIKNAPDLARHYALEWKRVWDEATPLEPNY
jgi:phosphatidylserine/phosphatidylglycerophosphate/cardiolipin synthase-like enzyme